MMKWRNNLNINNITNDIGNNVILYNNILVCPNILLFEYHYHILNAPNPQQQPQLYNSHLSIILEVSSEEEDDNEEEEDGNEEKEDVNKEKKKEMKKIKMKSISTKKKMKNIQKKMKIKKLKERKKIKKKKLSQIIKVSKKNFI